MKLPFLKRKEEEGDISFAHFSQLKSIKEFYHYLFLYRFYLTDTKNNNQDRIGHEYKKNLSLLYTSSFMLEGISNRIHLTKFKSNNKYSIAK